MLSLGRFPLIAMEPYMRGEMVGNLTNLNLSMGLLLDGKKFPSLGSSVLEKLDHGK